MSNDYPPSHIAMFPSLFHDFTYIMSVWCFLPTCPTEPLFYFSFSFFSLFRFYLLFFFLLFSAVSSKADAALGLAAIALKK